MENWKKNGMEKWYFEQISDLTDNQAQAFKAGVGNEMGKVVL